MLPESTRNLTINHFPDEVLLEIFDSYRRSAIFYKWKRKYVWFNLAHVCRKWRAIMFASTTRLDLGITVGPLKPAHIKTILSGTLPIFIKYDCMRDDLTRSALWRLRTTLKQHDRVREISVEGTTALFDKFFRATNCTFPVLESLVLRPKYGEELTIPDTFLGGPDLSHLHLRYIRLARISLSSVSRLLLSTSTLIELSLQIDNAFGTSVETPLLACLQGMPLLCRLYLFISSSHLESTSLPSTLKDIVPLSNLTNFAYFGHCVMLDALVAGLSAPFLQSLRIEFNGENLSPIVHLSRFINETEERCNALHISFHEWALRLSVRTHSNHDWLRFRFRPAPRQSAESIMQISDALSTKLTTIKELCITFSRTAAEDDIPWCRFHQQFPNVKLIRTEGRNCSCIARTLLQDQHVDDVAFFPALEKIELGEDKMGSQESRSEPELAAFDPFISARQRAGRPVNVCFRP